MPRYSYGTVPVLAWIINHYFYGGVHYAWLAEEFHPLTTNPKSSNPYLIYNDLYWPWAHLDEYDKFVDSTRDRLYSAVDEKQRSGVLDDVTGTRLKRTCRKVSVALFYPVVYRVDTSLIEPARGVRAGSAEKGSREILIPDLAETEFDLLFTDNRSDPEFRRLVIDERLGITSTSPAEALAQLEGRIVQ